MAAHGAPLGGTRCRFSVNLALSHRPVTRSVTSRHFDEVSAAADTFCGHLPALAPRTSGFDRDAAHPTDDDVVDVVIDGPCPDCAVGVVGQQCGQPVEQVLGAGERFCSGRRYRLRLCRDVHEVGADCHLPTPDGAMRHPGVVHALSLRVEFMVILRAECEFAQGCVKLVGQRRHSCAFLALIAGRSGGYGYCRMSNWTLRHPAWVGRGCLSAPRQCRPGVGGTCARVTPTCAQPESVVTGSAPLDGRRRMDGSAWLSELVVPLVDYPGMPTKIEDRRSSALVRYRPAAGDELVSATVARVSLEALLAARPVREFRWYKGRTFYSGWYWSATTGGLVAYESRLELARILLADFDPGVCGMVAQPFQLEEVVGGRRRRHVPDLLLHHCDGRVTVVDVKPAHRLADPVIAAAFAWTAELMGLRGWAFEVWSGVDPVVLANVRFLAGYRRSSTIDARLCAPVLELVDGQVSVGGLERAARLIAPQEHVRPVVLHLLWSHQLRCDLSVALGGGSPIWRAEQRAGVIA
ncbi:TnsA-like heteromeric transposase endonuclease subunit [Dactylosporangium sp. CA-139066]|uniref:TnsA-like heteromeric transposase endonuclease subunit n=1 Tax=Dactylosporangium sp. CA-139066 TaxID=3239930 RepID=UPI003D8ED49D